MPALQAKALVAEEEHAPFRLVDVELDDEKLAEDEVLVKFHASGICHTDLGSWTGKIAARFPCILGHEGAGEVVALGKSVTGLSKGDHVIASFCSCGGCSACQREEPGKCDLFLPLNFAFLNKNMQPDSVAYSVGAEKKEACIKYFGQSSFASAMRVSHRSLTKIPKDVKPSVACALACGFQTGFSTVLENAPREAAQVKRSFDHYGLLSSKDINIDDIRAVKGSDKSSNGAPDNIFANQTLMVSGIGAVGLGALIAGKMLGFGKMIAVDINPSRLELAKRAGASETINAAQYPETEKFVEQVKQVSVQQRGPTLFIEASGAAASLKNGIMSLAVAGKAIILGSPPATAILEVPYGLILAHAWTVEGVLMGNSEPSVTIPYMVELVRQGKLDILQEITKIYKPEQMNDAVHDAESGSVIKAVIEWT